MLSRIERGCDRVSERLAFVGVIGILLIALMIVSDVLLRWLFSAPIRGMNEIVEVMLAVAIAAVFPSGVCRRVHLSIDLLAPRLPHRVGDWLVVVGDAVLLVMLAVFAWSMGTYANDLGARHAQTSYLGMPQAPTSWCVSVLFAVSALLQMVMLASRALETQRGRSRLGAGGFVLLVVSLCATVLLGWWLFKHLADTRQNGWLTLMIFTMLWVLAFLLIPLGPIMALLGMLGTGLSIGGEQSFVTAAGDIAGFLANPNVATLPLFLLMGSFAAVAGVAEDLYRLAQALLGRFKGGLAHATIGGCAGFGAVTGSSLATSATIGRAVVPEMVARGYSPPLITGCVAAGGTLGALVPPGSGPLVVFALLTEASIGELFIASVGPAVLIVLLYLATITLYVHFAPGSAPDGEPPKKGELGTALRGSGAVTILFAVVMGGLYLGVFTATESAAVGACGAFIVALVRGKLRREAFWGVMAETTQTTAMIYVLIFGALMFSFFVGISGVVETAAGLVAHLDWPKLAVILLLLVLYVVLGTFMDSFTVMIITVPVVTPVILNMGYSAVWWGVIMLIVVEAGNISPPFGLNMFVLKTLMPDVPMGTVFKGVMPFFVAALVGLAMCVLFPEIITWLPASMPK